MRVLSQKTRTAHKPFNNQKQKKNVLSKQHIQRVNGKKERVWVSLRQFALRVKSLFVNKYTRRSWKINKGVLGSGKR